MNRNLTDGQELDRGKGTRQKTGTRKIERNYTEGHELNRGAGSRQRVRN
jgi:hypothetical protein